jgi:tungstate transport system ATP-binding protein
MKANNRLAVVVTHDLYQAQRLADEVIFMDRGKIIEQGPGGEVFNNPQNVLLRRILNKE